MKSTYSKVPSIWFGSNIGKKIKGDGGVSVFRGGGFKVVFLKISNPGFLQTSTLKFN